MCGRFTYTRNEGETHECFDVEIGEPLQPLLGRSTERVIVSELLSQRDTDPAHTSTVLSNNRPLAVSISRQIPPTRPVPDTRPAVSGQDQVQY